MRGVWIAFILAWAPAAEAEPLDAEAAVARALARHPALRAASDAADAAHARADQARSSWLPRADLEALYRHSGPVPELKIDTGITPPGASEPLRFERELGSADFASALAKVGWRAWDFGRSSQIAAAEAQASAAEQARGKRAVELAFAVRQAWHATVFFRGLAATTHRSLALASALHAEARSAHLVGIGREVDAVAAAARVAELEARSVEAHEEAARAEGTLRLLLGLAPGAPLELARIGEDAAGATSAESSGALDTRAVPAESGGAPDAGAALDAAARVRERPAGGAPAHSGGASHAAASPAPPTDHPRLLELEAGARAFGRQDEALARGFWPSLDVFASAGVQTPEHFAATDGIGYPYAVGAQLTWPLFDADLRSRRRAEAQARAAEMSHLREAAEEDLARALLEARARERSAAAALHAAARRIAAAEAYLAAARSAAAAGVESALDARKAEETLDQAHVSALRARFDAGLAEAATLQALGVTTRAEAAR